mmetsp:Transcript_33499/g.70435  ORF Transcript_33499/g.70435 Transcript_33499/m.70435 type:complete len:86 (+) Transcript_33499:159-416(+)
MVASEREKENLYPKKGWSVSIQRVKMFVDKCNGKEPEGKMVLKSMDTNAQIFSCSNRAALEKTKELYHIQEVIRETTIHGRTAQR